MRTLDRYLAGIFLRSFAISVLSMSCLFLFQALLGQLFEHEFPGDQVLIYHLLNMPQIIVQMMPPSILLATTFTLSGLTRTNELVACNSIGVGISRIMAIILSIVFMVCCFVLVMQDRICPPMYKKRQSYYWREMKKRPDFFVDIKKDKVWYRSRNMIYNLQLFDAATSTIQGMSIYAFDENFHLVQFIDAKKANFTSTGWKLTDGTVTVFSPTDPFPKTQKFADKNLIINETPHDFQEIEKEVDGLRLKELYGYIKRMKDAGADTKSYEVKFHSKISLSFIPIIMCILAVPFSLRGRREGGAARDFGLCLAITFFYWLFFSIGLSLGTNGTVSPVLAAWLPSLVFGGLALFLIARQKK